MPMGCRPNPDSDESSARTGHEDDRLTAAKVGRAHQTGDGDPSAPGPPCCAIKAARRCAWRPLPYDGAMLYAIIPPGYYYAPAVGTGWTGKVIRAA